MRISNDSSNGPSHMRISPGPLSVSLPANSVEFARSALDAGADSVKVHINLDHAGGRNFGPLREYEDVFREIIGLGAPVGIVPGAQEVPFEDIERIRELGFAFCNGTVEALGARAVDAGIPLVPSLGKTPASQVPQLLASLDEYPGDWMEGFPIEGDCQGLPLRWLDLLNIRMLGRHTRRKVIVPSVHALTPDDVPTILDIPNVGGLLLGVIVLGDTPSSVFEGVSAFRSAIDAYLQAHPESGERLASSASMK